MLQRSFYLPEKLYTTLRQEAKVKRIAVAALIREYLREKVESQREKRMQAANFLLKLAGYKLRGPKDLASNHDKYAWE